jgi:hypothetical protein
LAVRYGRPRGLLFCFDTVGETFPAGVCESYENRARSGGIEWDSTEKEPPIGKSLPIIDWVYRGAMGG